MKNKLISRILILIVLFSTLFSFCNLCMADENNTLTKEELDDRLKYFLENIINLIFYFKFKNIQQKLS